MKKNLIFFIFPGLLVAVGGFFLLAFLFTRYNINPAIQKRSTAYATPPPTLALAKTGPGDAHTKPISLPAFNISFRVPNDLKTKQQVDPTAEGTLIGSNFIALFTPDTVIDPKTHTQTSGAKLSINIVNTNKDFTSEEHLVPTTSINDATTDQSVIPASNALLNDQNMKVYSFPADKSAGTGAWIYNAEALVKSNGNILDITFYCSDYSNGKDSPVCKKLLTDILPTINISEQPRKTVKPTAKH